LETELAPLSEGNSFRWHRSLPWIAKGATLNRPAEALVAGRHHSVPVGGIISFWWAASFRYDGRDHLVLVGGFARNQHDRSHRVGPWPTGRRAGCHRLISAVAPSRSLADDASYDSDGLRRFLLERGTTPVIPNNATRKRPHPFDEDAYPTSSNACSAVSSIGDASPRATINSQQTSPQPSPSPPSSSGKSD
jgi:hypothetical protein